jgi:hypothetical protein
VTKHAPEAGLGPKHEPKGRGSIQVRGTDGEWHELEVERKQTGDPELDAIWAMSFRELQRILEDESHPLHEKAKQVSNEITRPITDAVMTSIDTAGIMKDVISKIGVKGWFPLETSWFAKLLPDVPEPGLSTSLTKQLAETVTFTPPPSALTLPAHRSIDLDTPEPPDASLVEIKEAAELRAHEMRGRQVELLSEMLAETRESAGSGKEALEVSRQALAATKSSKRAGWIAAWAAIVAAVIGGGGIVITILLSQ